MVPNPPTQFPILPILLLIISHSPPLNEVHMGNDFKGTDSVGVSVNTAVCSGSQKVEKHKVTKKSDWRFLTDFSTKNGKQHGTLN